MQTISDLGINFFSYKEKHQVWNGVTVIDSKIENGVRVLVEVAYGQSMEKIAG